MIGEGELALFTVTLLPDRHEYADTELLREAQLMNCLPTVAGAGVHRTKEGEDVFEVPSYPGTRVGTPCLMLRIFPNYWVRFLICVGCGRCQQKYCWRATAGVVFYTWRRVHLWLCH